VALGEQQPRPLRGDGVEQAGHGRVQRRLPGLGHRLQRSGRVALGLPDPGQSGQPRAQRRRVPELPAQRDAIVDLQESAVELIALVGHLGEANMRGSSGRRPRHSRDGQGSAVGLGGRVQPALGALDLAELIDAPGQRLAGLPPSSGSPRSWARKLR
jgi:hypothetical protein